MGKRRKEVKTMRTYSENFKKQVVKKVLADGVQQREVCRKLNISESSIIDWKRKYADEVKAEIERVNIDQFFIEEEVNIDKLLLASELEAVRNEKEFVDEIIAKGKIPSEYTIPEKS